ncbi:O-antigen ligase family protein [Chromobacterium piscinae]|uniref:O-antigen ligase family protein n=1 Tax=Chromobacterium piscinae TaxID=686831 RepID=A0ABV0H1K6_9NEIS
MFPFPLFVACCLLIWSPAMGRTLFYELSGASLLLLLVGLWRGHLQYDKKIWLWLAPLLAYLAILQAWLWRFPSPISIDLNPVHFRYGYQLKLWLCSLPMLLLPVLWPAPRGWKWPRRWLLAGLWCVSIALSVALLWVRIQTDSGVPRVTLNGIVETLMAFLLVPFHLLPLLLTLRGRLRGWQWGALLCIVLLQFGSVAVTGTRAAMIAYPLAVAAIAVWRYGWRGLLGVGVALSLGLTLAGGEIVRRAADAKTDLHQYEQGQMKTSLGIRFSLWSFGWQALQERPSGQSLQARDDLMKELVVEKRIDPAALGMRTVHLHNDTLEIGSTLGWPGVVGWFALLLGFILYAWRRRGAWVPLIALSLGGMFYFGLVDSILFNWQAHMQILLLIVISFYLAPLLDSDGWAGEPR